VIDRSLAAMASMRRMSGRAYQLGCPPTSTRGSIACGSRAATSCASRASAPADLLRWRFLRKPGEHYRIVTLEVPSTRELRAYAVLRAKESAIELCDLFAAGEVEHDALLGLLVPAIAELGAAAITMRYLGNERIRRCSPRTASHAAPRRAR